MENAKGSTPSGLDVLRRMMDGTAPPNFSHATRIRLVEAEEGRVVFEGEPSEQFLNPLGTVHGGWMATILDSAMGCAVHASLPPGVTYTTLELKVNYVRAVRPENGKVRCEGRLLHLGRNIGTSEGRLIDAGRKLLAHGTTTCLIMRP